MENNSNNKSNNSKQENATRRGNSARRNRSRRPDNYDPKTKSVKTQGSNDVSWYAQNADLLKGSASVSFYTTVGDKNPLQKYGDSIPGVCALRWSPNLVMNGALQQAANSIYSFTVHANSRNYSYDPADQMMMILAGASVFSFLAHGIRAYGTMMRFNGQDKFTPNALIEAMGFNYDDLRSNLNKMWFDLNERITRCSQIWIPNTMPLIQRWFWMNSHIYRDGASVKAQYYMFVPEMVYYYDETSSETGTTLVARRWNQTGAKWSDYVGLLDLMIERLLRSEDRGIIFGDLLKAYGADKLYAINTISSDYKTEPVYDIEVLTQIENATITGLTPANIIQDQYGTIIQTWKQDTVANFNAGNYFGSNLNVLNFHQLETPTPEQIMVATRLKCMGVAADTTGNLVDTTKLGIYPAIAGTETITAMMLWYMDYSSGTGTPTSKWIGPYDLAHSWLNTHSMAMYMAFDWAPWLYFNASFDIKTMGTQFTGTPTFGKTDYVLGEYDNYTLISSEELKKMHTTAAYGLFGVPQI